MKVIKGVARTLFLGRIKRLQWERTIRRECDESI